VHEQVDPVLVKKSVKLKECPIPIHHYGKLDHARTAERWQMYYEIGKNKLALQTDNDHALKELAVQAGLLSKWEEAAVHWESYLERNPNSVDAYLNLIRVMAKSDNFEQANRYAQKAFRLLPNRSETIYNLALSELQTGQATKAAQTATLMVDMFPDDPDGRLLYAIAEICAGNVDEGSEQIENLTKTVSKKVLLPRILSIIACVHSAGFDYWVSPLIAELSQVVDLQEIAHQITTTGTANGGSTSQKGILTNDNRSVLLQKAN
jgi:tetratricopeptide (TPR) repeat protein